jgi:hypothetical protein
MTHAISRYPVSNLGDLPEDIRARMLEAMLKFSLKVALQAVTAWRISSPCGPTTSFTRSAVGRRPGEREFIRAQPFVLALGLAQLS